MKPDAIISGDFNRDILEWNIPERVSVIGEMVRQIVFYGMNRNVAL